MEGGLQRKGSCREKVRWRKRKRRGSNSETDFKQGYET